jgi:hypothetical protein
MAVRGVRQDVVMRLDHISYACNSSELADVVQRIGIDLGNTFVDGGRHPSFGTRNFTLPLAHGVYIEIVSALDHPSADKAPFGRAVAQRANSGGGWMSWVVATDDLANVETALGRSAAVGHRIRPDGVDLHWRQLGVLDSMEHPQSPFFIEWESPKEHHPAFGGERTGIKILSIEINSPTQDLGPMAKSLEPVTDLIQWKNDPDADDFGVTAVTFETPHGHVRID